MCWRKRELLLRCSHRSMNMLRCLVLWCFRKGILVNTRWLLLRLHRARRQWRRINKAFIASRSSYYRLRRHQRCKLKREFVASWVWVREIFLLKERRNWNYSEMMILTSKPVSSAENTLWMLPLKQKSFTSLHNRCTTTEGSSSSSSSNRSNSEWRLNVCLLLNPFIQPYITLIQTLFHSSFYSLFQGIYLLNTSDISLIYLACLSVFLSTFMPSSSLACLIDFNRIDAWVSEWELNEWDLFEN